LEEAVVKHPTRLILFIGFGTLVVLVGILGFSAFRRAEQIYRDVSSIHETYQKGSSTLYDVQTDTLYSGILVRDYLLDTLPAAGPQYRKDLLELRSAMEKHLTKLSGLVSPEETDAFKRLRRELDIYWDSLDPIFDWTPIQKTAQSSWFLKNEILPRRTAILAITQEIDTLSATGFQREQNKIRSAKDELRRYLRNMFVFALCFALVVSGISFSQISRLERKSQQERVRAENAENEMRRLSQKLVQTQEEERKSISRELHDEIGQMLTGLRMELANVEMLRTGPIEEFLEHLAEAKTLAEKTLNSVRNLAMGLRPSMLDDLGLGAALQWQGRDFERRSGIPVNIQFNGNLENIEEEARTCVYRVVQESLTNCARHAQAKTISISVQGSDAQLSMAIQDDGIGFDPQTLSSRGLGLIGMEERVRELGGTIIFKSQPKKGTLVQIDMPLRKEAVP
jgi:signal transduction histidine kinase